MICRFIDTGANNAFANMAIDEALAISCTSPILRVYQWKPKAVSVGYNQDITKEINTDFCKSNGIGIVRRITGGKAIFHGDELTYSFILPENISLLPKGIVESYKIIAEALIIALNKMGINANIKKINEKIKTPICFNSSNWYEIKVNNKKISGSAQRRFDGKILQHGSVLLDFDYEKNERIFNSGSNIDLMGTLKERITSIKNELKKEIDVNELKEAIKQGFQKNFCIKLTKDNLSDNEIILAKNLLEDKYKSDEWNLNLPAKTI